jgi:hypothetical protein
VRIIIKKIYKNTIKLETDLFTFFSQNNLNYDFEKYKEYLSDAYAYIYTQQMIIPL